MKIIGIMPEVSPYSPRSGPVSVWCREVYQKIDHETQIISPETGYKFQHRNITYLKNYFFEKLGKETLRKIGLEKVLSKFTPYNFDHVNYSFKVALNIPHSSDVLHIQNRPEYAPIFKTLHPSKRVLLHLRNSHLKRIEKYWGRYWSKKTVQCSDGILGNSKYMVSEIRNQFPSASEKVRLLYNGTNEKQFHPEKLKQSTYEIDNNPRILFVGRLSENKGVHLLIEAIRKVVEDYPDATLVIVGASWFNTELDSEYYHRLKDLSEPIRDNIEFTGYVPHAEIPEVYRSADLCVVPSIWKEPFGVVVCESMATGLPTIVTDRGGPPEIVGDTGIVVNPEDTDLMAEKIELVLSDSSLAHELGRQARRRIEEKFTWNIVAEKFSTNLSELFGEIQ